MVINKSKDEKNRTIEFNDDDPLRVFSHYLHEMKYLYLSTEKQFIEFSEIVPFYKNDWNTYSPRLYSILQSTCSQVESMIKRITEEMMIISKQSNSISPYYNALNNNDLLNKQRVMLIPAWKIVSPFEEKPLPNWWTAYNSTKHNLPNGVFSGTMENTIKSIAGLYCLHNLAFLIMHGTTYDVTKDENWEEWIYPKFRNQDLDYFNNRTPEITHSWKSKLFNHTRYFIDTARISEM